MAAVFGAAQTAAIGEVGIQGYFVTGSLPTRVRVLVAVPSPKLPEKILAIPDKSARPTQTINLTLAVSEKDAQFGRVDRFSFSVDLAPGEARILDLPVPIFAARPVLTLDAADSGGRSIAHQSRELERLAFNKLVLLLCAEEKTCSDLLGAIQSSGSDEVKTRKTQQYTFLVLKELPEQWWIYSPAHSVVLARPAAGLSPTLRSALEDYCRQRGQCAVLDSLVGPGILDAYRTSLRNEVRTSVGSGYLYFFRDSADLAAFFDRSVSEFPSTDIAKAFGEIGRMGWRYSGDTGSLLATVFEFPTLRWLLVWLVLYIVVVGAVNFYLLTRWNRRELAWVTVPAIALLFAAALYLMGAAKRPDKAGLDEIATYVMDDVSAKAAANYDLRVSSPVRQDMTLAVPGDAIWAASDQRRSPEATFSVFNRQFSLGEGWTVRLSPQREFRLPMLQWSYQDLSFSGIAALPGSVRVLESGQLVNETGFSFRQAVFRDGDQIYDLGAVGAGGKFAARAGAGEKAQDLNMFWPGAFENRERFDRESHQDVKRLLTQEADGMRPAFAGLAEVSSMGASLEKVDFKRKQYVVVVVRFRK